MKNKLLRKTYINFLIQELLWSIILPIITIIILEISSLLDFQWLYDLSPKMYFIISRLEFIVIIIIFIWIAGTLFLLYNLLKKVFSYIDAISIASNELLDKEIEYITLPVELEELQIKMNNLKRESIKNEKLALTNEQRKNNLIVYLAHDLKTPLTSLIGYLSLLDEIKDMPEKQKEKYTKIALEKGFKLEELINELFEIARFNSEAIVLEKEEINLNLMLEQIVDDFYPLLKENNKRITITTKSKITLEADPIKLARVFNNLIKNAIYYSTDELITIDVTKRKQSVKVVITNKGKTIPKEKIEKIFEKFYRVETARTSKNGGTGLGLAIAKEIITLHAGSIKVTSNKEITKFYIELPITKN